MQKEINPAYRIYPLGDRALSVDWGNRIDPDLNARSLALFDRLQRAVLPGITNLVPAYSSLTLIFDAVVLADQYPGQQPYEVVRQQVLALLETQEAAAGPSPGRLVEIPVCYAPGYGPDLDALARSAGLSSEAVIDLHSATEYRVYMLGFLPGFAYLGRVDRRIAAPRRASPRTHVPAGSVGIAGEQTGIYPQASPGGWNLIGRTPLPLFDARNANPTLLHPGDRVRFYPVSPERFHQLLSES